MRENFVGCVSASARDASYIGVKISLSRPRRGVSTEMSSYRYFFTVGIPRLDRVSAVSQPRRRLFTVEVPCLDRVSAVSQPRRRRRSI